MSIADAAWHPACHRIEATTRCDNIGMQRALGEAGFRREGCLRDAWSADDGSWFDALVYGILRREWVGEYPAVPLAA